MEKRLDTNTIPYDDVVRQIKNGHILISVQSNQFNYSNGQHKTCLFIINTLEENDWIRLFGEDMEAFSHLVPKEQWYDENGVLK